MQELTKKERRELAKQKKAEEKEKEVVAKKVRKFLVWFVAAAFLFFVGFKAWIWVTEPAPEVAGIKIEATQDDWFKGNVDAKILLVEYGDYQCPACASYNPFIKSLGEEFSQDLKIVYRHYPLPNHKNAIPSALAAEAAGKQGKFWEMHDLLYEKQSEWTELSYAKEKFVEYAKSMGLDEQLFLNDYESQDTKARVDSDSDGAKALGINSTPTFFLNGERIQPRSYEEFKSLVEAQKQGYTVE